MKLFHVLTIAVLLFICTMIGCVSPSYVRYEVYKAKIEAIRWARVISSDCQVDISKRLEEAENMVTQDYMIGDDRAVK